MGHLPVICLMVCLSSHYTGYEDDGHSSNTYWLRQHMPHLSMACTLRGYKVLDRYFKTTITLLL